QALEYYKEESERLIVIYDDIDIPTGTMRIRKKGSAGTHNGMKSIVNQISTGDFPRIRVGIGSGKKEDLIDYVTGGVTKSEKTLLEESLTKAADGAACIVEKGIEKAMNEYNIRPKKEKEAVEEVKND
ncbi:MAG: peptidyl-tRNA hydrolase, partial [Clostridiales bacterium]|nr:peptidyl-tRNA hydrolase [Clostridiales bacterium]